MVNCVCAAVPSSSFIPRDGTIAGHQCISLMQPFPLCFVRTGLPHPQIHGHPNALHQPTLSVVALAGWCCWRRLYAHWWGAGDDGGGGVGGGVTVGENDRCGDAVGGDGVAVVDDGVGIGGHGNVVTADTATAVTAL